MVTPESLGREMADILRTPAPEAEFELRGDPGVVTSILDAARHIAMVEQAGGVTIPVPYGIGRPVIGRQYLVESTPRGDRWIKSAGIPWCKTWTVNDDFNEDGATFEDDMLNPALRDRLELPAFLPFGDGADGAGVHDLDGGDVDLGTDSICGRGFADAEWAVVAAWSTGGTGGTVLVDPPFNGLAVGDEILLYCAQALAGGSTQDIDDVGRWEVHRVSAIGGGGASVSWEDYAGVPGLSTPGTDQLVTYCQRIPNYTTISQSGSLNVSAITCGAHHPDPMLRTGTGVVFVRASVQSTARYTSLAKGFPGGENGEHCEDLGVDGYWEHSNPGHGKREPNGSDGDGGNGKFGGGSSGGNGHCLTGPLNAAHVATYGHNADAPSVGGGGGHATAGEAGDAHGATQHSRAPFGMHYAGRPDGAGGIAIGQSDLMNPAAFYGVAMFGGGGGSAGDYFLVHNNPGGPGGNGGGFVAVFAKIFHTNGGSGFTIPTIDVNGSGGSFLAGGGAAGSILAYADEMGSSIGLDPWFMAERVNIVGANQGWSGLGGGVIGNADVASGTPGQGAVGRVQVHYETTLNGYAANGSVNETSGALTYAGCWASAIYSSADFHDADDDLPLDPGLLIEPTALRADWTLDSDGLKPTFYLIGGNEPDLSDGVTYPSTAPAYWQDGSAHDINDDTDLDLSPYVLAPALYWQVWACLDTGANTGDTPTILEVSLCGVAQ